MVRFTLTKPSQKRREVMLVSVSTVIQWIRSNIGCGSVLTLKVPGWDSNGSRCFLNFLHAWLVMVGVFV